jgi:hypothetical protein
VLLHSVRARSLSTQIFDRVRTFNSIMYRAISKRLWERPLDMNLRSTSEGELQIPFSHFVLPAIPTESLSHGFPRFLRLPAELQLRIISFCDNQTLFHLMHTSSYMRSEAKKTIFLQFRYLVLRRCRLDITRLFSWRCTTRHGIPPDGQATRGSI